MLLFNCKKRTLFTFFCLISIHLMLLFNKIIDSLQMVLIHFNTSNVTIQQHHETMGYDSEYISIHLMLLFNVNWCDATFRRMHFNTSNVTIQRIQLNRMLIKILNFNTSNVTIQPYLPYINWSVPLFQYI